MLAVLDDEMTMPEQNKLRVNLLGGFSLTYGDKIITSISSERSQSLLAYLILNCAAPQSRQRMAFYFWPDSSDEQARTNLRRELHHLRRHLPDAERFIESDTKTVQWRPTAPLKVDVVEFERSLAQAEQARQAGDIDTVCKCLERAADLYRGKLLPDCYEEWVLPEQERLQQSCIQGLQGLIRLLEDRQDYAGAIRYAQQLLRVDPLNEATYRNLMQLHAVGGDRASALRVYQQCIKVLAQELGVDPDPATRDTYNRLLLMEESLLNQAPSSAKNHSGVVEGRSLAQVDEPDLPPSVYRRPASRSSVIGRESEWQAIQAWSVSAAQSAATNVLFLVGEPGIGKTRLLEELEASVRAANGQVLWGRGFEAEILRPYGAWIDALRSIALRSVDNLPTELGSLLPELGNTSDSPIDRSRLFDAVVRLLSQLAASNVPTVVILDDVQWLDEASTALLHYATRLLSHSPVLFACASRPHELEDNAPMFKFVQALRRDRRIQTLELSPLTPEQTLELAQTIDSEIDGAQVFADSGGNPLFVLEVARASAGSDLPCSNNLEALIRGRLRQLNETVRDVLPWAAALGRSFNLTILADVADYSPLKLLAVVEELEQQGIISPATPTHGDIGYDFTHDIVRQVVYRQLSEPRRRLIHRQIALALNNASGPDDALMSDVAHHATLGDDHTLATFAALKAAQRSLRLFAYVEAAELARRGLQHCQHLDSRSRVSFHIGLLKVYVLSGVSKDQVPQLTQELHQLIAEASAMGLNDEEAIALETLIVMNYDQGNLSEVHKQSLKAVEQGRNASPNTAARVLAYTGWCLAEIEREMHRAEALLSEAQSLAERVGVQITDIPCGLGCVHRHAANFDEARQLLHRAWTMANAEQDHWRGCLCLLYLAMTELEAGQFNEAIAYCQQLAHVAEKIGESSEGAFAAALDALARYALNQPRAHVALEQSLLILRQIDAQRMLAYTLTFAAEVDLDQNRVDLAITRTQEALYAAQLVNHPSEMALAWAVLARSMMVLGRDQLAQQLFQDLQRHVDHRTLSARARRAVEQVGQLLPYAVMC